MVINDLSILRHFLLDQLGLSYTKNQEQELYAKIDKAAVSFGYKDTDEFINWLVLQDLSNAQVEKLAQHLTIGETYFLREKEAYNYLEFFFLPQLIAERRAQNNKTLKLWSAGCASGEEPYSLAILLRRMLQDIEDWDITILATDINPLFLEKAKLGEYSKWSFRRVSKDFTTKNFDEIGINKYKIKSEIQKMVSFSFLNLIDDQFPSIKTRTMEVDVIFCRNVMIYFSQEGITGVGNKFHRCLQRDGILIVSPVEVSSMQRSKFNLIKNEYCHVFNKDPKKKSYSQPLEGKVASFSPPKKEAYSSQYILGKLENVTNYLKDNQKKEEKESLSHVGGEVEAPRSVYEEALAYYHSDKVHKAEEVLRKYMIESDQLDDDAVLLLARILANSGEFDEASDLCKKVLNKNKVNATAYYLLAVVYSEQGKRDDAIRAAENALFLDPNNVLAHYTLGSIKLKDEDNRYYQKHFDNIKKLLSKMKSEDIVDIVDNLTVAQLKSNITSLEAIDK